MPLEIRYWQPKIKGWETALKICTIILCSPLERGVLTWILAAVPNISTIWLLFKVTNWDVDITIDIIEFGNRLKNAHHHPH